MKKLLFLLAFLFAAGAAQAQFADQRQYAGASGGSANAQTVAIPNYALNPGVVIRFVPNFTNTGPATLSVNGGPAKAVELPTVAGLVPLYGGEIVAGQVEEVVYDKTQFELIGANSWVSGPTAVVNGTPGSINLYVNPTQPPNGVWTGAGNVFGTCPLTQAPCGAGYTVYSSQYIKDSTSLGAMQQEFNWSLDSYINTGAAGQWTNSATASAGSFAVGGIYQIATVGTTNFVAIGAASNTVGVIFQASGVGSGTGTATTAYAPGQCVDTTLSGTSQAGNIYCTAAGGTPAATGTGPSGTSVPITDGSVIWTSVIGDFANQKVSWFNSTLVGPGGPSRTWGNAEATIWQAGWSGIQGINFEMDAENNSTNTSVAGYDLDNLRVGGGIGAYPLTADIHVYHGSNGTNFAAEYGILFNGVYEASVADIFTQTWSPYFIFSSGEHTSAVWGDQSGVAPVAEDLNGAYSLEAILINGTTPIGVLIQGSKSGAALQITSSGDTALNINGVFTTATIADSSATSPAMIDANGVYSIAAIYIPTASTAIDVTQGATLLGGTLTLSGLGTGTATKYLCLTAANGVVAQTAQC